MSITGSNPVPHTFMELQSKIENFYCFITDWINMERLSEIHENTRDIKEKLTRDVAEFNVSLKTDSQTERLITNLQNVIIAEVQIQDIKDHLPTLNKSEVSARASKLILGPLKKADSSNPFGGQWNEWTAKAAATRLGFPKKKLHKLIAQTGPTAQALRDEQAKVSAQVEQIFRHNVENGDFLKAELLVKTESWIHGLILRTRDHLRGQEITKNQKEQIILDSLTAFIRILAFAKGQQIETNSLLPSLLKGRMDGEINLVVLQCMTFNNSVEKGITVVPHAQDIKIQTNSGQGLIISQRDSLDEVSRFAEILTLSNILHTITIIIFDNDKIVLPKQEENIDKFIEDFNKVVSGHTLGRHNTQIVRGSDMVNPELFREEWEKRNKSGDNLTENLVDIEFDRLQDKTLPVDQKSRRFARSIAMKGFLLQTSLGANLTEMFDNLIILQRTKAQQQASEILRLGAKIQGNPNPNVIAHWKDRRRV